MPNKSDLTVALAGFGAVGRAVARRLDQGIPGLTLTAIAARDSERARSFMSDFRHVVPVEPLERLPFLADVVVECLPPTLLAQIAEPALRTGRTLIVLSCGALLDHPQLRDLATQYGGRIIVPTGALIGLDAMQAAMEGVITSVRMVTRKPPRGLVGAPYLAEHGIDLAGLREPLKLFSGSARDGVRGFPANVNVAVALSLEHIHAASLFACSFSRLRTTSAKPPISPTKFLSSVVVKLPLW